MPATFTGTPTDMNLGPCRVKFNSVDLGITSGGVKVTMSPSYVDLKGDQYGDTPIDTVLTGQSYTVELTLAEVKNLDNLMLAIPYGVRSGSGATDKIVVSAAIGTQMGQFAEALELHPMAYADATKTFDWTFHAAYVKSALEVEFGANNQQGYKLTFQVIPDGSNKYVTIGDAS